MVILKKIKASSLNEVLVATVIIVLVFGIAMAILSNLLRSIHKRDNYEQNTVLHELIYQYNTNALQLPYVSSDGKFSYDIHKEKENNVEWIHFEITAKKNNKKLIKKLIANEED